MTVSLERTSTPVSVVAPAPSVRWLAVFALAFGGFGIGTTEFVAMGLLPDIASSFAISEPTAGHVISAYALGVVVGAPLIAALTARMPRKTVLLGLMAVFTLSNLASMFAPSYELLIVGALRRRPATRGVLRPRGAGGVLPDGTAKPGQRQWRMS